MKKTAFLRLLSLLLCVFLLMGTLTSCDLLDSVLGGFFGQTEEPDNDKKDDQSSVTLASIPPFTDKAYVALNGNQPNFTEADKKRGAFEEFAELDSLGRCGVTFANVCKELMPTEARESIGAVKPTGWQTVKYDIVDGKYLYNRCHLIGFQLTGENANKQNLITGTRYLNIDGMLGFENLVADYVKETGNHVLYRVTPIFVGNELVARGVVMEGWSVEDNGEGVCFNVFAYNNQPGITIDYKTGESHLMTEAEKQAVQEAIDLSKTEEEPAGDPTGDPTGEGEQPAPETEQTDPAAEEETETFILNTSKHTFHLPTCSSVKQMSDKNKQEYTGTRLDLLEEGYSPCGSCKP